MDIDRSVELATERMHEAANPDPATPPKPESEETCIACKTVGTLLDSGWHTDVEVVPGSEGDYLEGDPLMDATETAHGWVCSARCASQAMYDHAENKAALNSVVDACRAIRDYGSVVDAAGEDLEQGAAVFLDAIHDDRDDPPEWLNRPSREDSLLIAINRAIVTADYIAKGIFPPERAVEIAAELRKAELNQ